MPLAGQDFESAHADGSFFDCVKALLSKALCFVTQDPKPYLCLMFGTDPCEACAIVGELPADKIASGESQRALNDPQHVCIEHGSQMRLLQNQQHALCMSTLSERMLIVNESVLKLC